MTSVLQEVLEVNKMPIEALRKKYKELFNAEAPLTASRRQLIPKITYQLQVLTFGGISPGVQRMIDNLNQGKNAGLCPTQKSHHSAGRYADCQGISWRNLQN